MDNIRANSFLGKHHEIKMGEGARELSVAQKSEPALRGTLHQNISLIVVFVSFSQTNLQSFS